MKILIMGLGYIGLPTSVMFANHGQKVIGVDINTGTIEKLKNGQVHIEEPGLQEALQSALHKGNFKPQLTPEKSDVFIIAVPTPNNEDEYQSCDLSYVLNALENVLPHVEKGNTIIVESTIAPRSTEDYILPLIEEKGFIVGEDIFLVHCPERVLPGQVLEELVSNNRIIGGVTPQCTLAGKKVYETFVQGELILTQAKTAELSKLMENTYRDVNIALSNELTKIANDLSINVLDVIEMANKHPRVNLHMPGPGVGGHCLAVDPYFIAASSPEYSPLIQLARKVNNSMPEYIFDTVVAMMDKMNGNKITVMGLTYKGDIDDVRESPAMKIYKRLTEETNFEVIAFDPHVEADFVEKNLQSALENSDMALILSDHSEFKKLNQENFRCMRNSTIFDTKNIVEEKGAHYYNLGNLYEMMS